MKKLEPGGMPTMAVSILAPLAVGDEEALAVEFTDVSAGEIIAPVEMARVAGSGG